MLQKILSFALAGLVMAACDNPNSEIVLQGLEKDLVPEGIAIESNSGRLFLSSLRKNKIVTADIEGKNAADFIESYQHGYLSGFGLTIKGDTLYALGNDLKKKDNSSTLLLLNIKTGELIDSYKIKIDPYGYLNDLAISADNNIFITESQSNKVYRIQRPGKSLEIFLDTAELPRSNGIAISDDNTKLYLASKQGIRVVDIRTKKILNPRNKESAGIDGMKFYKNSLIGILERGVFRYYLNENGTMITDAKEIIPFDSSFRSPTTFDINGNAIYFIKDTQLDNFNDSTLEMTDNKKLESLILLKKNLD